MKKKMAILLSLAMIVSLIAGCGGKQAASSAGGSAAAGSSAAATKDELVVSIPSDVVSMDNSAQSNYVSGTACNMIYDALYWDNMDGTYSPHIATDLTANDDCTEWTLTIRDDVQFADGDPLTAEDVAWTINTYKASSYRSTTMGGVSSAEAKDDTHVLIKCDQPYAACPAVMHVVRVMNKSVYESTGAETVGLTPPEGIGSGPYIFDEWVSGTYLKFHKNENYSFPDKAAKISNVTLKVISESSTQMIALESGDIDAIVSLSTADVESVKSNPDLQVQMTPSLNTYWMCFNCEDPVMKNEKVRQAISYAFNRDDIVLGAFDGYGSPSETIISDTVACYDKSFKANGYDPEKAKALLAEAGYPDGLSIKIDTLDDPAQKPHATILQAQLAEIGIKAEVVATERSAFYANIQGPRNFQTMTCRLTSLVRDADFGLTFLTLPVASDQNRSWCCYTDQDYFDAVVAARGELDEAKRTKMYGELFQYINDHALIVATVHDYSIVGANANLKNVVPSVDVIYELARWSW